MNTSSTGIKAPAVHAAGRSRRGSGRIGRVTRRVLGIALATVAASVGAAVVVERWPPATVPTSLRVNGPKDVSAVTGTGQVTVRWTPPPGAVWYQVLRADGDGGRFVPLSGTAGRLGGIKRRVLSFMLPGLPLDAVATPMFVDTLVEPGHVYRYRVVAWDGERPSEPSAEVRLTAGNGVTPQPLHVRVDAGRELGPLVHSWEGLVNLADIEGLRERGSAVRVDRPGPARSLRRELGFARVRLHGILGDALGVYREDGRGQPVLDWRALDAVFDAIRADGCTPWVLLSYMPHDLASDPKAKTVWGSSTSPPKDLAKWSAFVRGLAGHLVERYGRDEVASWYFEVWSEPDLHLRKADFWAGSLDQYFELYDASAAALRSADSRIRVGGPGAASLGTIEAFLRHVASARVPLAFLSMHLYGTALVDFRPVLARYGLSEVPVIYSEWGISGREEPIHDLPYAAAWIGRVLTESLDTVSMMGYWTGTDDLPGAAPDRVFRGGFGLSTGHSLRKPAYQAFALLHRLGERRIVVDGSGDGFDGLVQVLASRSNGGGVQVLVTNATYDQSKASGSTVLSRRVEIEVSGLRPGHRYRLSHARVDNDHAGAFGEWRRLGSPPLPTEDQLAKLRAADRIQDLVPMWEVSTDDGGTIRTSFDLPMPALSLLEISPEPSTVSETERD
jgi:xylan 1,4-beta-xylosidase